MGLGRKKSSECRARSLFRNHIYEAVVVFYDSMDGRKAKAGSTAHVFQVDRHNMVPGISLMRLRLAAEQA